MTEQIGGRLPTSLFDIVNVSRKPLAFLTLCVDLVMNAEM
jgi:hypothetical protein